MKEQNNKISSDLFGEIKNRYDSLSKSHKKIARFMMQNYEKVAELSAVQVAEAVGISEATVVRFAVFLGFDGYVEFKKTLKAYITAKLTTIERIENAVNLDLRDAPETAFVKNAFKNDLKAIHATLESFDHDAFKSCVELLLNARRVMIIGFRSVSFLADYMHYYLNILLDDVRLINQSSNYADLVKLNESDVVLAISFPRYSQSALETVEYAKRKNAKIIVISDHQNAPPSIYADVVLSAKTSPLSFVDSFAAPMALINALIVAVGSKKLTKTKQQYNELEEIWKRHDVYADNAIKEDLKGSI